jgi:uncharacterized protein
MINNFQHLQNQIVERLLPLDPDKIVLFGSYAYGTPNDESDIDLFLIKSIPKNEARQYTLQARKMLRDLIFTYKIGFDILTAPEKFIKSRQDHFYQEDIIKNGKVLYAK